MPVDPLMAGVADQFVGIEFDTLTATDPMRVTEVIVEGQTSPPATCATVDANLLIWDVTTPGVPELVYRFNATTKATNDRSYVPVNAILQPGKVYRLVAAVAELRSTPLVQVPGRVQVSGGLTFTDADRCSGTAAEAAVVSPSDVGIAFRYHPVAGAAIVDLGGGLAGAAGIPSLSGAGEIRPGTPISLTLSGAAPNSPTGVIIGNTVDPLPLFGGMLIPALDTLATGFSTNALGEVTLPSNWPTALAPGQSLYFQIGTFDLGAPNLVAMSNALAATTQP
jgi:hypothetical protein